MDRLQSMRVFSKVVELGSFARAAQHLSMSNAVVTRYVADLEAHLGTRLLNRTTRSLSLTDVGETYLQRCAQILLDIDEAESLATSRSQALVGGLRIVAPVMFGLHVLPMLLARFQQLYPEVTFDVALSDRPIDIVEDGRDVGIMVSELGLGSHLVALDGLTLMPSASALSSTAFDVIVTNFRSSASEASSAWSAMSPAIVSSACSEEPTWPAARSASISLFAVSLTARMRAHFASSVSSRQALVSL